MLHMRNRPLSDCREEKKGRKGAWRPYFCNWLLHPYFKKILGFPLTSECCTCGNDPYRTAERKKKGRKGAWRPYFCNWLLHPYFKKTLGFPLTSECCTCVRDPSRTVDKKHRKEAWKPFFNEMGGPWVFGDL